MREASFTVFPDAGVALDQATLFLHALDHVRTLADVGVRGDRYLIEYPGPRTYPDVIPDDHGPGDYHARADDTVLPDVAIMPDVAMVVYLGPVAYDCIVYRSPVYGSVKVYVHVMPEDHPATVRDVQPFPILVPGITKALGK